MDGSVSCPDSLGGVPIVVTGASGFIGSHLVDALVERGAAVTALSRRALPFPAAGTGVRWVQVDLSDVDELRRRLAEVQPRCVYHLSSLADGRPLRELVLPILHAEVVACVNVLTLCSELGVPRVVLTGSLEAPSAGEEPTSPYGTAKAASALYARLFYSLYRLPVVVARIFMAYGPRQPKFKLIPSTLDAIARGESPVVRSPARGVDWIYVSDVVDGLLPMALAPGIDGRTIDLGSGELVTVGEVVQMLCQLSGGRVAPVFAPADHGIGRVLTADIAPAAELLGWTPKISLREGLELTIQAFQCDQCA
jgi:nucleoside-diphosphate-sugar epimerase